ncbi:hypothetical protein NMY22_g19046 [Coprinellus aureogranulatus]|nr:hypothetical protein NMY22_g19046 [Coprinellus aureogranulatus]
MVKHPQRRSRRSRLKTRHGYPCCYTGSWHFVDAGAGEDDARLATLVGAYQSHHGSSQFRIELNAGVGSSTTIYVTPCLQAVSSTSQAAPETRAYSTLVLIPVPLSTLETTITLVMNLHDLKATIESTVTMNEIVPNLWLGDLLSALNMKILRKKGVGSVLSVMRGRVSVHETFIRHQVALDDMEDEDILVHMSPCIKFIEKELAKGHGVLVHCQAGVSTFLSLSCLLRFLLLPNTQRTSADHLLPSPTGRSATIITAYLMSTRRLSPSAALSLVRTKRAFVDPNPGFLAQLEVFHQAGYIISRDSKVVRTWYLRREVERVKMGGEVREVGVWEGQGEGEGVLVSPSSGSASSVASSATLVQIESLDPPSPGWITTAHEAATLADHNAQAELNHDGALQASSQLQAGKQSTKTKQRRIVRCRMCRYELAGRGDMLEHTLSLTPTPSSPSWTAAANVNPTERVEDEAELNPILTNPRCSGYFVEPVRPSSLPSAFSPLPLLFPSFTHTVPHTQLQWMPVTPSSPSTQGKILCPNKHCNAKIGNYTWVGMQCGCGGWAVPGFCLGRGKVEEVLVYALNTRSRSLRLSDLLDNMKPSARPRSFAFTGYRYLIMARFYFTQKFSGYKETQGRKFWCRAHADVNECSLGGVLTSSFEARRPSNRPSSSYPLHSPFSLHQRLPLEVDPLLFLSLGLVLTIRYGCTLAPFFPIARRVEGHRSRKARAVDPVNRSDLSLVGSLLPQDLE